MFTFLVILIIILCLFITMIVLIQNPKGGGLTGGVGNTASNIIGVQSAGDIMETMTEEAAKLPTAAQPVMPQPNQTQPAQNPTQPTK